MSATHGVEDELEEGPVAFASGDEVGRGEGNPLLVDLAQPVPLVGGLLLVDVEQVDEAREEVGVVVGKHASVACDK